MEWMVEAETLSDFIDHGRYTLSTKPLIRCKDCKWKNMHNCTRAVEVPIDDDKYCAWAERRRTND